MRARSARPMVDRCFRHQHPEAYGTWPPPREPQSAELRAVVVCDVWVPQSVPAGEYLPEEPMGIPRELIADDR